MYLIGTTLALNKREEELCKNKTWFNSRLVPTVKRIKLCKGFPAYLCV